MYRKLSRCIAAFLVFLCLLPAHAWAAATLVPPEANRQNLIHGILSQNLEVTLYGDNSGKKYCIPANTTFEEWTSKDTKSYTVYVRVTASDAKDCTDHTTPLTQTSTYVADSGDLEAGSNSDEWVLGVMTIPFKYYEWGDRSFVGNATAGGYFGYQVHLDSGLNITTALIGGPSFISVPATGNQSGTPPAGSTQSANAITYGLGFFFSTGDGSGGQFGVAFGRDNVGHGITWENNEHGWLAFQIGYKFF